MSLADALEQNHVTRKGPCCTLCSLLESLDKADARVLANALSDASYTHNGISRALRAEGHNILPATVSRHRKGECAGGHR